MMLGELKPLISSLVLPPGGPLLLAWLGLYGARRRWGQGLLLMALLSLWPRRVLMRHAPLMLSLERARRMRHTATVVMAGVVASLSLSVALTVMVASFRGSVSAWLDVVLPADLYARTARVNGDNDGLPCERGPC